MKTAQSTKQMVSQRTLEHGTWVITVQKETHKNQTKQKNNKQTKKNPDLALIVLE